MPERTGGSLPHDVIDDATIGLDADGRVMSASTRAAAALGYSNPEELEGRPLSSLMNETAENSILDLTGFDSTLEDDEPGSMRSQPVTFVRKDGTSVRLEAIFTPETSGGWITLMESEAAAERGASLAGPDITAVLRGLAEQTSSTDSETQIAARFAEAMRHGSGAESVSVQRSTGAAGLYDTLATATSTGSVTESAHTDLPPALIPARGQVAPENWTVG